MAGRREAEPNRRPVTGGRLDEAALSLGAEPVTIAADRQHVAVMQEPVEDRGGDHGTGEHGCRAAIRVTVRIASHIDAPGRDQLPHLFCSWLGLRRRPGAEMAGVSERPASSAGTSHVIGVL